MKSLYESLLDDFDTINSKIDPLEVIKQFLKDEITDVIISSVVPIITSALTNMFKKHHGITPKVIGNKLKTGIKFLQQGNKLKVTLRFNKHNRNTDTTFINSSRSEISYQRMIF